MHEHDQDLIAALAEGTLPPHEAAMARPEVLACSSCRAELELQQRALAALRTAPRPTLTELERARLRRAVLTETAPRAAVAPQPPRRIVRWMPAFATAAVLVVAVGAAAFLRGAGRGDFDAAETATDTTVSAAVGAADEGTAPALEDAAVPEEVAPQRDIVRYSITADRVVVDLGAVSLEQIEEQTADLATSFFQGAPEAAAPPDLVTCSSAVAEGLAEPAEVVPIAVATVEGRPVEVFTVTDEVHAGPLILVVDRDDCSVTATFGP